MDTRSRSDMRTAARGGFSISRFGATQGWRCKKGGESGFRSRCLVVANDALYRLS